MDNENKTPIQGIKEKFLTKIGIEPDSNKTLGQVIKEKIFNTVIENEQTQEEIAEAAHNEIVAEVTEGVPNLFERAKDQMTEAAANTYDEVKSKLIKENDGLIKRAFKSIIARGISIGIRIGSLLTVGLSSAAYEFITDKKLFLHGNTDADNADEYAKEKKSQHRASVRNYLTRMFVKLFPKNTEAPAAATA